MVPALKPSGQVQEKNLDCEMWALAEKDNDKEKDEERRCVLAL
jgi:hypothetical protein